MHAEPLSKRAGQHSAASGGADDRELLQGEIDRARCHALAEHDVDAEVFHDRIDELFDRAGEPVDLVDKQDGSFGGIGQERQDVLLLVERRPARDAELDPQLVVQDRREGGLAQTGGTIEEDMGQRLASLLGRGQTDRQAFGDGALADDLAQAPGPELLVNGIARSSLRRRLVRLSPRRERPSPPDPPLIVGSRIARSFEAS